MAQQFHQQFNGSTSLKRTQETNTTYFFKNIHYEFSQQFTERRGSTALH